MAVDAISALRELGMNAATAVSTPRIRVVFMGTCEKGHDSHLGTDCPIFNVWARSIQVAGEPPLLPVINRWMPSQMQTIVATVLRNHRRPIPPLARHDNREWCPPVGRPASLSGE